MSLRRAWKTLNWCARQGGRLSLWSTWVLLLVALAGQIHLLSARRVPLPDPLRHAVERRLAALGLDLEFRRGWMNLTGHFILEDVRLGAVATPSPLATARSVYLRLDPWDLLTGHVSVRNARIGGLDLHLPAALSDSGEALSPATNIDLSLRSLGGGLELSHLTGYIGRLPVSASGRFRLPAAPSAPRPPKEVVGRIIADYLAFANRAHMADAWLSAVQSPDLRLRLNPTGIGVYFHAESIDLAAIPKGSGGKLTGVRAETMIPLDDPFASPLIITGAIKSAELPRAITAHDLAVRLQGVRTGVAGFFASSLDVELASLHWRGVEAGPIAASATRGADGPVGADVSFALAGSPWRLRGDSGFASGGARVRLDGFVDDATLAFVGAQIGRDLTALLDPAHPAPLHASASFGPDWKLIDASGRLHSGPVRVGGAQLDETGAEFTYDGARVLCESLVLRQGESLAQGTYEMDTRTLDFRFLLTGRLRPEGIESWFHDWWRDFWSTFDFSRGLPAADVDVRGRWGDLTATRVFVQAEGAATGLKGVAFDRVRTRLFLRPHWFDILHFDVLQAEQQAAGWLNRSLDLEQHTWRHMEFDVESTLPLETISTLFEKESAELLAPYRFTTPPRLRLNGRVDSAASPGGKRERIDIALASSGAMTYHGFPLADLRFDANLRDDRIDLPVIAVNFAEGQANGKARLWGEAASRRLAFDIALADANLGSVTESIARFRPPGEPVGDKDADAAHLRQIRLEGGRLVFTLAAEGPYANFYGFKGNGRIAITGTELAKLNLFGPLSEMLRGPHFSFGSFSLTTVDAPFTLDGERLHFENLRITGPNALLQADGDYGLRDGRLDFTAKIHPFDESPSMVGSAVGFVLSPLSAVFEVKLQGTPSKPSWIFSYGPSRLLNTITGGDKDSRPPVPAPSDVPQP